MQGHLQLDHIFIGDVLETIKNIPDNTVRCCVTSPPYFALRDYGTGTWQGGDENCDHSKSADIKKNLSGCKRGQEHGYAAKRINKVTCTKCGAIRIDDQIGLEETPELYVQKLVTVFREVRRILTHDGTLWLNLGDSYWGGKGKSGSQTPEKQKQRLDAGTTITKPHQTVGEKGYTRPNDAKHAILKPKDLIGIPWRVALALQADGWYLRSDIIWAKQNHMPESVTDRPTKGHEYIFLLSKSAKYYYDSVAIRKEQKDSSIERNHRAIGIEQKDLFGAPGQPAHTMNQARPNIRSSGNLERKEMPDAPEGSGKNQKGSVPWEGMTANKNTVWSVSTKPFKEAHFATYPEDLIVDCIKAGSSEHGRCAHCGAAYTRIVKRVSPEFLNNGTTESEYEKDTTANRLAMARQNAREQGYEHFIEYKTIGWKKHCKCDAGIVPDIVFDPFMGAATTGLVAKKEGRNFLGCELNKEYIEISVNRLSAELGLFYQPQKI